MTIVAQAFALAAALAHLLAFIWESLLFERAGVHRGIFRVRTADVPPVRLWAFNVGFYNLFLAAGPIAGVISHNAGQPVVGRTLVLYSCAFMVLAGVVLFVSDRRAMSRPKGAGIGGSLAQTVPALGALISALV